MIKELSLKNFRSIQEMNLNFDEGIYCISGDNGKGKSSIMYSVALLMLNYAKDNLDDYIRWGTLGFDISLKFDYKGVPIEVFYKHGRNKEKLCVLNNNSYKNSEATKKLETLINPKLYLSSVFSFEGDIDIVNTKPSERREFLKKVYNLDYRDIVERLSEENKKINDELIEIRTKISALENKTYNFKTIEQPKVTELQYRESLSNLKEKKEILLNKEKFLEVLKNNFNLLENYKKDLQKTENNLNNLKSSYENSKQKIMEYNNKKSALLAEKDKLELDIKNYGLVYSDELYQELSFKKNKLSEILKQKDSLKENRCFYCGNLLNAEKIKEIKDEIEKAEKEIPLIEKDLNSLINLKGLMRQLYDIEKDIKNIENLVSNLTSNLKQMEDNIKFNTENIENIKKSIINITVDKNEIDSINEEIKKIRFEVDNLEKIVKEYENYQFLRKNIEEWNNNVSSEKKNDTILLENLKKEYSLKGQLFDENEKLKIIFQKEFPVFVINNLIRNIENGMNDVINTVYDGRYNIRIVERKDNLYIQYGKGEDWLDISCASGFEKSLFSFSWKFCLAKLVGSDFLFLDEVDSSASDENAIKLYRLIAKGISFFKQIFLVTHKTEVRDFLRDNFDAKVIQLN